MIQSRPSRESAELLRGNCQGVFMAFRVRPDGSAEQPGPSEVRTSIPSISPVLLHTHKTLCSQPAGASLLYPPNDTFLAHLPCPKSPVPPSLPKSSPSCMVHTRAPHLAKSALTQLGHGKLPMADRITTPRDVCVLQTCKHDSVPFCGKGTLQMCQH